MENEVKNTKIDDNIRGVNVKESGNRLRPSIIIIIIISLVILIYGSLTAINIVNANNNKPPLMYFAKTVEQADGSITYNVFPYKVVVYKNHVTTDEIYEIMWFFTNKANPFYDPNSPYSSITKPKAYKPVQVNLDSYVALVEDVVNKMEAGFFKKSFDEKVKQQYNNPNNINISTNIETTGLSDITDNVQIQEQPQTQTQTQQPNQPQSQTQNNTNTTQAMKYKKIYISTTLDDNTFNTFKGKVDSMLKTKENFQTREIIFAGYDDLKDKAYISDGKLR